MSSSSSPHVDRVTQQNFAVREQFLPKIESSPLPKPDSAKGVDDQKKTTTNPNGARYTDSMSSALADPGFEDFE